MKTITSLLLLLLQGFSLMAQDGYNDLRNFEKFRNTDFQVAPICSAMPEKMQVDTSYMTGTDLQLHLLKKDSTEIVRRLSYLKNFRKKADSLARLTKTKYAIHLTKRSSESRSLIIKQDSLASEMQVEIDSIVRVLDSIKKHLDSIEIRVSKINENIDSEKYREIERSIKNSFNEISRKSERAAKQCDKIEALAQAYQKAGSDEEIQKSFISSFPQIANVLGNSGAVIPTLNLLGNQYFNKGLFKGEIRVFASAASNSTVYDWRSLVIQEQSNFGILLDVFKGFWVSKRNNKFSDFGLRGSLGYLMKPSFMIQECDSSIYKDFSYGTLQYKLGFEYIAFSNVLTIHGDYTGFSLITNLKQVNESMPTLYDNRSRPSMGFYNLGARFRISPSGFGIDNLKSNYLVLDLNFTIVNDFLSRIIDPEYKNNNDVPIDKVVPALRISLKI